MGQMLRYLYSMRRFRVTNASLPVLSKALFLTKALRPVLYKALFVTNALLPVLYETLLRNEYISTRTL